MLSKIKYKVVFIDWNGTISGSKFWGHLENPNNPNHYLFSRIENVLFGELRPFLKSWMRGQMTSEDILKLLSKKSNLPYNTILEEFIESCKTMTFTTTKLASLIRQLQNYKIKVVVATDNMDSFPRWTVPSLELSKIFDDILDSYTLKAMKGDFDSKNKSLFFADYLEKHDLEPGECILIDDSEDKDLKISKIGIEYRKIEPMIGLETELESILSLIRQNLKV